MTTQRMYDHEVTVMNMITAFRSFAILSMLVTDEDIKDAKDTMSKVDALGPFLDPTKFRNAMYDGSLDRQKDVIRLFDHMRTELKRIFPVGWPVTEGV